MLGSLATDLLSWRCSRKGVQVFGNFDVPSPSVAGSVLLKMLLWLGTPSEESNPEVAAEMSRRKVGAPYVHRAYLTRSVYVATPQWLWGFYLLRSPVFELVIKSAADKVRPCRPRCARLSGALQVTYVASYIPLLGLLIRYLRDIMLYFQRHYFYVAGSS